jgi:error-prone DNA polymerase
MRLAIVAAGFTPGEADQLRRAMGAWRKTGVMDQFRQKLISGMLDRGYNLSFAESVFNQIRGFGEYGFPESHAASFALLVYVSSWIKRYYPEAFLAGLINSQPMGFYAPAQLVADARRRGVKVRPVDVNISHWECTLEGEAPAEPCREGKAPPHREGEAPAEPHRKTDAHTPAPPSHRPADVRLGFCIVSGLSQAAAERIIAARAHGPFLSIPDFTRRTRLGRPIITRLARADAFGSLQLDRRQSLWQALEQPESGPLDDRPEDIASTALLEPMHPWEHVLADYRATGLSLRDHPLRFLRHELDRLRVTPAKDLATSPDGRRITVAGLVLLRQRPGTASGITFVTLEDETGMTNLIVYPAVWEKFHVAARTARLMLARGILQRQHDIIHVLVDRIDDLSDWITSTLPRSRDFR